ncbi:MAG: LPS export ABC transporter periplasmic protein LptC [Aquificaceae bacterium]|nr:LPS export ABC transporter periplasmic protein LptC [Aquificaceae bacterium]
MLKSLVLGLVIALTAYALKSYVENFKFVKPSGETANVLEGVTIRSYGKEGVEWIIRGTRLEVMGKDVKLTDAELYSKDASLKAEVAYIDRSTGKGELEGDVMLLYERATIKSQKVYMDLKEGSFESDKPVEMVEDNSKIEGKGFRLNLRPLQVIINRARTKIE